MGAVGVIVAVALLLAWKFGLFGLHDRAALAAAIERAQSVRFIAVFFVATYTLAAAFGVPATPFTLAGGALFGVAQGIALNWIGEMLAALLAFGITRATGLRFGARARGQDGLPKPQGRATLFRLRLIPVAPFALLNAGAALSGMTWRDYAIATGAGIIPITIIYTVSASRLVEGVAGSGSRALTTAFVAAGALALLSFAPAIIRLARRASGRGTPPE